MYKYLCTEDKILILQWSMVGVSILSSAFIAIFAGVQARISRLKKKNDLFIQRYDFYKRLSTLWLSTCADTEAYHHGSPEAQKYFRENYTPCLDYRNLIGFAKEAKFLFGKDIHDFILSLQEEEAKYEYEPEEWFEAPFIKYLKLK